MRWFGVQGLAWCLATSTVLAAGCTAAGEPGPTGLAEGSLGVLTIERGSADAEPASPAALGASFARYRGIEADAVLDIVGAATPGDGCVDPGAAGEARDAAEAEIELLDVGPIVVRAASSTVELAPRTFPAVGDLLAGVFYAGEAELPPVEAAPTYAIAARGNGEIGPFEAIVDAADAPAGLRVDGPLDGSHLRRGRDLELSWTDPGRRDAFVQVAVSSSDGVTVASCTSADDGSITVPAGLLSRLRGREVHVRVQRLLVRTLDVPGLDRAEARLLASTTLALSFEQ